jgi:Na+-driven multidrug efflux pump
MGIAAVTNAVYTYYVSRLGTDAIGAVALVFPVSMLLLTAMAGGIGAGASSAVARALGAGRPDDAAAVAGHAIALSVALGLGVGLAIVSGAPALFRLLGGRAAVLDLATVVARELLAGLVITFLGGMFDRVLRGEGNVRVPALWSSVSLLLQIVVTPVLMFTLGWGLAGAALAMLASQALATAARARFVFGGGTLVRPRLAGWPRRLGPTRSILAVGVPAALSTSVANVGFMALTGIVARLGPADLAAYGLVTRFDFLLLSLAYGTGAAVLTLVGLATGTGRPEYVRAYVGRACAIVDSCWAPSVPQSPGSPRCGSDSSRPTPPSTTSEPLISASSVHPILSSAPAYPGFAFQGLGRATLPLRAWSCAWSP